MTVIDDYLAKVSPEQKAGLERVRRVVQATAPEAVEVISYGMPGFKQDGKYLITFGAFKDHLSVFPGAEPVEKLADKLADFQTSKGTIQFTTDNPLPDEMIAELVRIRLAAIAKN